MVRLTWRLLGRCHSVCSPNTRRARGTWAVARWAVRRSNCSQQQNRVPEPSQLVLPKTWCRIAGSPRPFLGSAISKLHARASFESATGWPHVQREGERVLTYIS